MATSRSIQPSNNPYAGGAVIFDSSPYTQYALNQRAKEQAKEEALDNYFKSIDSKINSAGMRTQDIGDLVKQQNADRLYYLKNRQEILNPSLDGGKSYNEYLDRHQQKMSYVDRSKQAAEAYKPIATVLADPTKRELLPEELLSPQGALALHDLPINDPRHKDIDVRALNFNPKPFDELNYATKLKQLTPMVESGTTYEYNKDLPYERTPVTKITPNIDKDKYEQLSISQFNQDPSYRRMILNAGKDPVTFDKLNKIYQQNFGKEIEKGVLNNIVHPEQLAVAYSLALAPKEEIKKGKSEIDKKAYEDYTRKMNEASSMRKIAANKVPIVSDVTTSGNLFDKFGDVQNFTSQKGIKVRGGTFSDNNNNPYNGEIFITKDFMPADVFPVLKAAGYNKDYIDRAERKGMTVIIKDGRVQALKDDKLGLIDRQAIENAQLKYNTEPLKGKQPKFGLTLPTKQNKVVVQGKIR